ncbi:hypothetical protein METHP14_620016 [Pseudomonas sp. P14-2025]
MEALRGSKQKNIVFLVRQRSVLAVGMGCFPKRDSACAAYSRAAPTGPRWHKEMQSLWERPCVAIGGQSPPRIPLYPTAENRGPKRPTAPHQPH